MLSVKICAGREDFGGFAALYNGRFRRLKRTKINAVAPLEHCETVAAAFHNAPENALLLWEG